ncbi:TlpA family protein disulfide reductase [Nocardioides jishulii]|uniref:TlpA family protein disulfide reductase n=1 Tax=Nocardioides jishulii TaxID=2575440 RepID=UPI001EEFF450|nr:TlpA disulfide reductase family protein [Nocardioides jishulii]
MSPRLTRVRRGPARLHGLPRVATALLVAALLLTGCSSLGSTGDKGYISQDGVVATVDEDERGKPIELSGEDLDGEQLDLADLRGQVTVVNVWWSACPPCRAEMPHLLEAEKATEDIAQFVGINIRDGSTSQAKSFVRKFGVPYRSFYSPDGKALLPFSGTIPPNAIPSTVVLDAEGRVAATVIGVLPSARTLVGVIEDLSGQKAEPIDG